MQRWRRRQTFYWFCVIKSWRWWWLLASFSLFLLQYRKSIYFLTGKQLSCVYRYVQYVRRRRSRRDENRSFYSSSFFIFPSLSLSLNFPSTCINSFLSFSLVRTHRQTDSDCCERVKEHGRQCPNFMLQQLSCHKEREREREREAKAISVNNSAIRLRTLVRTYLQTPLDRPLSTYVSYVHYTSSKTLKEYYTIDRQFCLVAYMHMYLASIDVHG